MRTWKQLLLPRTENKGFHAVLIMFKITPYMVKISSFKYLDESVFLRCLGPKLNYFHKCVKIEQCSWDWPHLLISETNQFLHPKAVEILFVISAVKYCLKTQLLMWTGKCWPVNPNWVIDLGSSRQGMFSDLTWEHWQAPEGFVLVGGVCVLFSGGAPNYYPNSFSGPEDQPMLKERYMTLSGDVQRYNSANEDNVTQVWCVKRLYIAYCIRWV